MTTELVEDAVWQFDLGVVNAYLVDDGEVTLVDAGTPEGGALRALPRKLARTPRSVDNLREQLADAGYEPGDVDRVLVTHYDLDHVGGIAGLGVDAPVYAREPDASHTEGSDSPSPTNRKGLFQRVVGPWLAPPAEPVRRVEDAEARGAPSPDSASPRQDGDSIGGFDACAAPGHTDGHTVYVHEDLGTALVGDLVTGEGGGLATPPRFLTKDPAQNAESVRELASRDLDVDVVAMGHGDPVVEDGATALAELARRLD